MLVAEDLLLLLTDDETGKLAASDLLVDLALAGGLLVELSLKNKVDVIGDHGGHVVVRDVDPTGDPILDAALAVVHEREGKKPSAVLPPLTKKLRQTLYERLAASGIVHDQRGAILRIFPTHRWPTDDAHHEVEVRAQIADALVRNVTPDRRTGALIALLHALHCEHKAVDPERFGTTKAQLRTRAGEIAEGDWASAAVHTVIHELVGAITASTAAGAVAGR